MSMLIEVWGDYACFTRPEMKTERVSYDMITPSAARGLVEAIYWHPGLRYTVDRIYLLKPFGLDPEDEGNQKRLRNLENGQCLMQDLYGHVGVVQFHPVFADFLHGFDTKPPMKAGVAV